MKSESDCGNTREGGCARLESGTAFMPGVSEKRLEKAARKEKDKRAKFRLLACLDRKRGHSIRRIAKDLKTAYSTIRDWLLRMRDRGLKGRFNARPKGRRAGLPLQIIRTVRRWLKRSPKKCGFETGSWQMDMGKCSRHLGVFCHLPAVDPVTSQGNDPKRSDASAISDYVVTSKLNGQIFITCRSKY